MPNEPDPIRIFDRALLARRRRRVAGSATSHDFLLKRVADDLVERLAIVRRSFPLAANIGAHHGVVSRAIRGVAGVENVINLDASVELLREAPGLRVVADDEALPFANASLDLVVSGLSLQLVNDLPGALQQRAHVTHIGERGDARRGAAADLGLGGNPGLAQLL